MEPSVVHPNSTQIFPITNGYVIAQNADTGTLAVQLRDGQILPRVPVLYFGACDGLRINQAPLPGKGTQGIVLLVNDSINSAVWLGALTSTLMDAIGSVSDEFVDYVSHWSGFWRSQDSTGSTTAQWPDSTQVIVGSAFSPTRHTVASDGTRRAIPFTQADRVASVPPGFPISILHSSGAKVTISGNGAVYILAAPSQTLEATANGSVIEIDGSGNLSASSSQTVTVSGTAAVLVESATSLTLQAPHVYGTAGGTTQELATKTAWDWLTSHTHSGIQTGGGNSGPPNSVPTVGVLTTNFEAE